MVRPLGARILAGRAHVVLDVAATEDATRIDVLEAGEDFGGRAADDVGHDVETAAMAHGEDGGIDAESGTGCEHGVQKWDECGEAFQGKALCAEVAGLDGLLEDVGADEFA